MKRICHSVATEKLYKDNACIPAIDVDTCKKPHLIGLGIVVLQSKSLAAARMDRSLRIQQKLRHRYCSGNLFLTLVLLLALASHVQAWGNSESYGGDETMFGNSFDNDWLYSGSALSFQVEGCAWGYVEDSEESGCLEDESEEGTTNWYMMASCRRPQVIFSVFAGSSCSSGNFVGSVGFDCSVSQLDYIHA